MEAGSAGAGAVGHGWKEEADAKVPAWLINRVRHSIAGTDFPDEANRFNLVNPALAAFADQHAHHHELALYRS